MKAYIDFQPLPRPPMSPYDGEVVALFEGVWHADPITPELLESGEYLAFSDFQLAANGLGLATGNGSYAFTGAYGALLKSAEDKLGRYGMDSPYYPYCNWGSSLNTARRDQVMLSTQNTLELLDDPRLTFSEYQRRIIHYALHDVDIDIE